MLRIPRGDGPLTWRPLASEDGRSATVVCPKGHIGTLLDHAIGGDGLVIPSVVCAEPGCDFHEAVTLERWAEEGTN